MSDLFIAATPSSPEVDFRFSENTLNLRGESYPENASAFYGGVIDALRTYLYHLGGDGRVTANIALSYFNSSSTKMLFNLIDALNQSALAGVHVELNWYHDVDDETIFEFGTELHADFPALTFHDHPVER